MIRKLVIMRFPKGRAKAVTLSYDDGVKTDQRLISIMNQYGLKGTFNINSNLFSEEGTTDPKPTRRMTASEAKETYLNSGHEVAIHGLNHGQFPYMAKGTASYEVCEDRRRLEEMMGQVIRGMAYPFGTYTDELLEVLRANEIAYSRTTRAHHSFHLPEEFLTWHPTCHHRDERLAELTQEFLEAQPGTPRQHGSRLFYLWGHSYEFENDGNWHIIEDFARTIGGREDIWYATNMEIYQYVKAFERLEFAVDQTWVYNPSGVDLWLACNEWNGQKSQSICVPAGKTAALR
ncbi:MAG: polysaccharide deacetylase family protein [Clostridia bacterium]|nr:polysaccharide deacetylase family protein [Clostridia bacterium]